MGFTVEDMLIISAEKYQMQILAGRNGWANSISWLLMVEDTTIIKNFKGKELVVTTGLGFETEEKLTELVSLLDKKHGAGLIVNTGYYIQEIPESVLKRAEECDLPLMTVPWQVSMAEMIKDLTVRIFFQSQVDEQLSDSFIKAIEHPQEEDEYRAELLRAFDTDGRFQVAAFTTESLDSMDTVDRKRVGYRLQIYLENISHNAHFFYYNGCFLMILNAVDDKSRDEIIQGFFKRAAQRMPDQEVYLGLGSAVTDVRNLHLSYKRAVCAVVMAMKNHTSMVRFDDMGPERLLYSVRDRLLLKEMGEDLLAPIIEYDNKHEGELLRTFSLYLKYGGSVSLVAEDMFIHKNTILYRMSKIRELLPDDPTDGEKRMEYYLATMIVEMQRKMSTDG